MQTYTVTITKSILGPRVMKWRPSHGRTVYGHADLPESVQQYLDLSVRGEVGGGSLRGAEGWETVLRCADGPPGLAGINCLCVVPIARYGWARLTLVDRTPRPPRVLKARCRRNWRAILDCWGADDAADLDRSMYKYTDCGPHLSVHTTHGWLHSGNAAQREIGHDALVTHLQVGSIVEGSDAEVDGDEIDLSAYADPQACVAAVNASVDDVNDQACALWEEAHAEEPDDDEETATAPDATV